MNERVALVGLAGVRLGEANGSMPSTRITVTFHLNIRASGDAAFHHAVGTLQRVSFDQPVCSVGFPSRPVYETEMRYHSFSRRLPMEMGCHSKAIVASAPVKIVAFAGAINWGAEYAARVGVGAAGVGVGVCAPRRVGVGEKRDVGVKVAVGTSVGVAGTGVATT